LRRRSDEEAFVEMQHYRYPPPRPRMRFLPWVLVFSVAPLMAAFLLAVALTYWR
jgi:hypothetical protein